MTDAIATFWTKHENDIREFFESSASGFIGTGIHLFISFILDFYIDINLSTVIGNIIGGTIDLILNTFVFKATMTLEIIGKFIVQSICGMIAILIIFNFIIHFIKKKHIYTNTFVRLLASSITFVLVAYPMRKLWVFKKS